MKITKPLFLIAVVFLLSAAVAADNEKAPVAKITQENAKALAIDYAKTNLKAGGNVAVVEIRIESNGMLYRVKLEDAAKEYVLDVNSTSGAVSVISQAEKPAETTEVKGEKPVKTEEKKKEEVGKGEEEKKMQFAQAGNSYSGKYVSFTYSDGGILNYSLGGKTIFDSISISGFTPVRIKAEGTEVKLTDKDERIELEIHDNPDAIIKITSEDAVDVNFSLAAGISATINQTEVDLTGINASVVGVGEEGTVRFALSGNVLVSSLDHAKIMFKATPLTARTEKEKEFDDKVLEGIDRGKIGAVVHIEKNDSHDEVSLDSVNVTVNTIQNNTVSLNVSSELSGGKTILITVSNKILRAVSTKDVHVTFDGAEIQQADNYADVMNQTGNRPKYLILVGVSDVEALVSIPKFSEHQITITAMPLKAPGFNAILAAFSLLFAVWYFVRRK